MQLENMLPGEKTKVFAKGFKILDYLKNSEQF